MKKKTLSLALAFSLVFALVPFTTATTASNIPVAQFNGFIAPIDNTVPVDAIRISTAAELAAIGGGENAGRYYVLNNDIRLTEEWVPIGAFHGIFDGQGYTVSNLYVLDRNSVLSAGLFAEITKNATIRNVGVNVGVLGVSAYHPVVYFTTLDYSTYSGGLVGKNNGGTIINCYVTGVISSSNGHPRSSFAGGLAGQSNSGTITNCYATGDVFIPSIASSFSYRVASAGGLIGQSNDSIITNCYATGDISVFSDSQFVNSYAGGIVGFIKDGTMTNCYATGRVSASAYVLGNSAATACAGGLVGYGDNGSITVSNSYATGAVVSESNYRIESIKSYWPFYAGGLIASYHNNCRININNSFYSSQAIIGNTEKSLGNYLVSWALEGIMTAVAQGFVPEDIQSDFTNTITRAEFCRLAVKWLEYKTGKNIDAILAQQGVSRNPSAFTDTSDSDILAAYALGITSGSGNNQFNPGGQFNPEQAAGMIRNTCKAAGMDVGNVANAGFADMSAASSWAADGINFCANSGIMGGTGNGNFSPKLEYTREQSILTFNNIKLT